MGLKGLRKFKNFGLLALFVLSLISCEKEIESIGVTLIDNDVFDKNVYVSEVFTENVNVERVNTSGVSQFLLGVYGDNEFGNLQASIITQLSLPSTGESYANGYGVDTSIDSVFINIPYQYSTEDNYSDGKPKFSLDSVFGNKETAFKLSVYELKTFLNTLDPNDPSKSAVYYSDKVFQKGDEALYSGNFKVNADDTVAYVKRYLADGKTVYDTDTIKETNSSPSIKIPLNKATIKQLFVDKAGDSEFASLDNFIHYFRGFYIEADKLTSDKAHLVSLSMQNAKMTIYYSKTVDETSEQDLNGNGIKGETGVRTKHNYVFPFASLKANYLKRDYTNSKQSGADRLYVQGAAGSIATIELFKYDDIVALNNKNWLITDAKLKFYIDESADTSLYPEQLFLYNYSDNSQITDLLTEGITVLGGFRDYETDTNGNKVLLNSYTFKITSYVSQLLKADDPTNYLKLGLKVYNSTDAQSTTVPNFNWNPKGVVLYNHNNSLGDNRIKLEISYTELNQ